MPEILYALDNEGGFTVIDLGTTISAYAYPTSTHAVAAIKHARAVALEMLTHEKDTRKWLSGPALNLALENDRRRGARLRAR